MDRSSGARILIGPRCDCRSWDSDDRPYPECVSYTNPIPERQLLQPGESQELRLPLSDTYSASNQELEV
jgi:hypothetical protein